MPFLFIFIAMRTHDKIRKLREAKNLTQEYMAHELDISPKTYSRLESGDSPLKLEHLIRLSEILEVSIEDLTSADPVSYYIGTNNNKGTVYGSQAGTTNNYNTGSGLEIEEMKKQIARLEAAVEKLLKQLPK